MRRNTAVVRQDSRGDLVERPIMHGKTTEFVTTRGVETTADQLYKRSRLRNPERIKQGDGKASEQGADGGSSSCGGRELPYNCHVHPRMSITAPAGLKIDIQTDLVTNGQGSVSPGRIHHP